MTYDDEGADQLARGGALGLGDLGDEVAVEADDCDEGDELQGPGGDKGPAVVAVVFHTHGEKVMLQTKCVGVSRCVLLLPVA